MKSVCLIVQNYYDIDPRVRRKAEALIAAGYNVDVIALRFPNKSGQTYTLNGVEVHTLPIDKKRGSFLRYVFEYLAFFIMASLKVTSMMAQKRYHLIDVNTLPDFLVFAALIPKWMGACVVLDMHEIMPEFYMSKYHVAKGHWLIRLIGLQERLSMRFADHVMTINEPIQRLLELRGLPRGKSTVLVNAADDALFGGSTKRPTAQSRDHFVMMYHGTLTRFYGLDIALEAFGRVQSEMPTAEFWIVGDGPERIELEHLVKRLGLEGRVRFIGMIPQQEIPSWLDQCHLGVLATRKDMFLDFSFSNKLPEYIIKGKPVIASRLKAIRHYFSDRALAFFEPEDAVDLSEMMVRLYKDPSMREDLVKQARKEYAAIGWDVMKQRYLQLVESQTQA